MEIAAVLTTAAVIWLMGRPVLMWRRKLKARNYWALRRDRPALQNAFNVIVLGDSISEGVGASRPEFSFVGRVEAYLAARTKQPIVIYNYAVAGATSTDLIASQLPYANLEAADLVLVEIGVNDGHKPRGSVVSYRKNLAYLIANLPLEKTIFSDMPFPKIRKQYQQVVEEVLAPLPVIRAYPSRTFVNLLPALKITAGDFWHPNDKGHELWFQAFRSGIDVVLADRESP